jgi:hypothetical protein
MTHVGEARERLSQSTGSVAATVGSEALLSQGWNGEEHSPLPCSHARACVQRPPA